MVTLIDAGPLVALLHKDDRNHARCVHALRALRDPLATVWPPVTEAMHLLGFSERAGDALWEMLQSGSLQLLPLDDTDVPRMRELMWKYRDLPMDLADAALVRVAEREGISRVFTLDRRHFLVYRPRGLDHFGVIP